jgi:hypothetical protein
LAFVAMANEKRTLAVHIEKRIAALFLKQVGKKKPPPP